uniref:Uncharacterized protein n=1 Tax=Rhizophora mucronata TaxID=61149 RepID=A0A2P2PFH7_RHIMU
MRWNVMAQQILNYGRMHCLLSSGPLPCKKISS